MKKYFAIIVLALIVFSCDKVSQPNPHEFENTECKQTNPIIKNNFDRSAYRKVLLEDYTGHYCGNCPPAAAKAEELSATYGSSLIVIANHVTDQFAKPNRDTSSTTYREDFRNPASTEWIANSAFGIETAGLPKGMINRIQKPGYPQNISVWSSLIPTELAKPQSVKLDVSLSYDPGKKLLDVKVQSTFLSKINGDVKLSMVIIQDSIISDQKDYKLTTPTDPDDPDRRVNYRFDHIVVNALNGTWGDLLKSSPNVSDTATVSRNCNIIGKCFYKQSICTNDRNMYLVVFAYADSNKEVLQVEKLKLR